MNAKIKLVPFWYNGMVDQNLELLQPREQC